MTADQFTNLMARDVVVIKILCDDLGSTAFDEQTPDLNHYGELIKNSKYEEKI